jgi:hypothetical protein
VCTLRFAVAEQSAEQVLVSAAAIEQSVERLAEQVLVSAAEQL